MLSPRRLAVYFRRALLCLSLALAFHPSDALAHAALLQSEPADGTVIDAAPKTFRLTFNEAVSPLVLRLLTPAGTTMALQGAVIVDQALTIPVPEGLGTGTHVLSWRVVSEDGHPVGGAVLFSIGASIEGTPPEAQDLGDGRVRSAIWAAKLALYLGLFVGVGGVFFGIWIAGGAGGGRGLVNTALALGVLAAPASLALLGLDALNQPLSEIWRAEAWRTGAATSFGMTALIAVFGLVLAFFAQMRASRLMASVALLSVGCALAASGHASSAQPQWLTRPSVFLHAVGVAFWVGALIPLFASLLRPMPGVAAALARFSRAVPWALAGLLASGVALAVIQLEAPDALLGTLYGWVFCFKLVMVAALLALAALNRWRWTAPVLSGEAAAVAGLRRSIAVEIVLIFAVLGAVALWRFTPPPRALPPEPAQHLAQLSNEAALTQLAITESSPGVFAVSLTVHDRLMKPMQALEVTLGFADPTGEIEPIFRNAIHFADNEWRIDGLVLPRRQAWTLTVEIPISDFERIDLSGSVALGSKASLPRQPVWPFAWLPSANALSEPELAREVVLGLAGAGASLLVFLVTALRPRRRWPISIVALAIAWFSVPSVSLLFAPAYSASLYRSTSGYTSASIFRGAALYPRYCAGCHGTEGRGDGPLAENQVVPPADLTAQHLWEHSDGELFWWLTHGMRTPTGAQSMPGFEAQLSAADRWNLIDYVRARAAGATQHLTQGR